MSFQGLSALVTSQTARDTAGADQGLYMVGVNPTPGTGIVSTAAPTALVETTPWLIFYNPSTTLSAYLMYLRVLDTAASTGGTGINFTHSLDTGNRWSSGGTALVSANVNIGNSVSQNKSVMQINVGALTATAKTNGQRNLGNIQFRSVIDQTGDKYEWQYGEGATGSVNPTDGTAKGHYVIGVPPVVVGPGSSYLINLWKASMSAAITTEFEMAWVER